eukprot:1173301-Rhodomonas_salina.1
MILGSVCSAKVPVSSDAKRTDTRCTAPTRVRAEYGNPDTDDWQYLQKYSPYHNVDDGTTLPPAPSSRRNAPPPCLLYYVLTWRMALRDGSTDLAYAATVGAAYPPILLTTSTRDDRVHPAHARKM